MASPGAGMAEKSIFISGLKSNTDKIMLLVTRHRRWLTTLTHTYTKEKIHFNLKNQNEQRNYGSVIRLRLPSMRYRVRRKYFDSKVVTLECESFQTSYQ